MSAQPKIETPHLLPQKLVFEKGTLCSDASCSKTLPAGVSLSKEGDENILFLAPDQCLVLDPVEIFFSGKEKKQLRIILGESSRLTLIERSSLAVSQEIDMQIELAAHAKFVHGQIINGKKEVEHKAHISVDLAKGAFYDSFVFVTGVPSVQREVDVKLKGDLANARLLGAQILSGNAKTKIRWQVQHLAPHGESRQVLKTVLKETAQSFFEGKVYVAKEAQKTDGYQLSRALLLSDKAKMEAKPELEIYADDVKCSHGSTVGALDKEELFYLRSRGISESEAKEMLVRAFINKVVDQIQCEELGAAVREEMEREMQL